MLNPNDRRYRYPFINCTDCGPRYTLIRKTPYDRPQTSMAMFKMCNECQAEYENPKGRRFHAQPNACHACGPRPELLDGKGKKIETDNPIAETARLLRKGKIIAIKGLGGYHLACDATDETVVSALRERKKRKEKPFAVMSKDIEAIRKYAEAGEQDEKLLKSREKPIVLLKKKNELLSKSVALGFNEYGVFLPYTPIHHLLFADDPILSALVMTSGNVSDEPIVFDESEALRRLGGIADNFLVNNRPIVWRCDDSVARTVGERIFITRRSRGFVPAPVFLRRKLPPMLACGGDLKSVFALAKGKTVFPGPHIGDLEHAEAFNSFRESVDHFKSIFEIKPEVAVVDKHPGYFSSNYGRSLGIPVTEVQHHHAHVASVMLENRLEEKVIGLALDGAGYGDDGTVWGGEIFVCDMKGFERRFFFPLLKLPGGDMAAKEPWRVATYILWQMFGERFKDAHPLFVEEIGESRVNNIVSILKADINSPVTSSAGRLFDAVASLLLISHKNSFEGQSPMLLESIADSTVEDSFEFDISGEGEIDFTKMLGKLVKSANDAGSIPNVSAMFHNTVASSLLECCKRLKRETGIKDVCLSGGTFQNLILLKYLSKLLESNGFRPHFSRQFPINDGGLAIGQIAVATSSF